MTVENYDFFFASQFLKYVSELLVEPFLEQNFIL